jgi:HEPN domain-containing protein
MATDEQVRNSLIKLAYDAIDRKEYDLSMMYSEAALRLGNKVLLQIKHQRRGS